MEQRVESMPQRSPYGTGVIDTRCSPFATQWPVPLESVHLEGGVW